MTFYHDFVKSNEYKNWTEPKKSAFQRYARQLATNKSPRTTDMTVLTLEDLQKLKKKVNNLQ